jgi:DNA-binding transcriptional LysR family regulator
MPRSLGMNLRQLEAFYWIVRLGSFSAAAEKLGMTQPTISARVKELERSLDRELFLRGHKTPRSSAAGRALFPLAEEALGVVSRIQHSLGSERNVSGVVRIGMGEIIALTWFPNFLARLNTSYPSVQLEIFLEVSANLNRMLDAGELDLALVVGTASPELELKSLGHIPLHWMVSGSVPGGGATNGFDALSKYPLYSLSRHSHLHARILKWLGARNIRPKVIHSCNSLSVIIKLMTIGEGVALLPPILVANELQAGTIRIIRADDNEQKSEFFLAHRRDVVDATVIQIADLAVKTTIFEASQAHSPIGPKRALQSLRAT